MSMELDRAARKLRKDDLVHLVAWMVGDERIADGIRETLRIQDGELMCYECRRPYEGLKEVLEL